MNLTDKTGALAAMLMVSPEDQLMIITDDGTIIRTRVEDIRQTGRVTQGVRMMRVAEGSRIVDVDIAAPEEDEEETPDTDTQAALEGELETLREVLGNPQDYLVTEQVTLRLNTLNVVVDADESGVAADVGFSLVRLAGSEPLQRAFVLARVARSELPETRINFADAQRYL